MSERKTPKAGGSPAVSPRPKDRRTLADFAIGEVFLVKRDGAWREARRSFGDGVRWRSEDGREGPLVVLDPTTPAREMD